MSTGSSFDSRFEYRTKPNFQPEKPTNWVGEMVKHREQEISNMMN